LYPAIILFVNVDVIPGRLGCCAQLGACEFGWLGGQLPLGTYIPCGLGQLPKQFGAGIKLLYLLL
tara:strand:- start:198 stop:392 length:195 start_codon:yes stop_codon:yes gene_type:complete